MKMTGSGSFMMVWIVFCILLTVLGLGCQSNTDRGLPETKVTTNAVLTHTSSIEQGGIWSFEARTIEHDGHLFIVLYTGNGSALLHHPDCPCRCGRFEEAGQ